MENKEIEFLENENVQLLEDEYIPARSLTIAMNVDKINQSKEAALALSNFINIMENNIGELDLDLTVSINPFEVKDKEFDSIGYKVDACGENITFVDEMEEKYENEEIEENNSCKTPARRVAK